MAHQLNMEEREVISKMHFAGQSPAAIGRTLGRHRTTVSREIARNGRRGTYSAVEAQSQAQARRRQRPLLRKLDRPALQKHVRERLVRRWSPDQIAGRLRRDFPHDCARHVCAQTIYRWIAAQPDDDRRHWEQFLRWKGRAKPPNDRRGHIPAQVRIDNRPQVVDRRSRYGDWEGDTIVGKRHVGGVVTLVERKSGYLLTGKVPDRSAQRVGRTITRLYHGLPRTLRRTLTLDNGKEFAHHEQVSAELKLRVFFAAPYSAWQRGTNEHTNGLLRQFFPKGTDFRQVSRHDVAYATNHLNHRPRERLNYQTPNEVFTRQLNAAIEK